MKSLFLTFSLFTALLFSASQAQAFEQADIRSLIVTVDGQEIRGINSADIEAGNYFQDRKIINITVDNPVVLKVEIEDAKGKRRDITTDAKTTWQVMGNRIEAAPGIVTARKDPIPGLSSFSSEHDAAVLIQYEEKTDENTGTVGSAYVYFRIAN